MEQIRVLIYLYYPLYSMALARLLADEEDINVVCTCVNSEDVFKKASKLKPDVAIIDINLRDAKGIEIVNRIKEINPSTELIVLSEYARGVHILPSLRAGALGYLLKDSSIDELVKAIRSVHHGEEIFDHKAVADVLHSMITIKETADKTGGILHERELEITKLTAKGMHNKEIASELCISERTVQTHLVNIFRKLGVRTRTEAVIYAIKAGWVAFEDLP